MTTAPILDPRDIENRRFSPLVLVGGADQETSKFSVVPGTLSDVLNYTSSTKGYQRAQGLLFYDGTADAAVTNMWYVGVDDNDATLIGSGFTLGGAITWGTESSGKVVFYERGSASPYDYTIIGIIAIVGAEPVAGDTLVDTETGSTLTLGGTLTYPPSTLQTAQHPSSGEYVADTVTKYLDFINNTVNAGLVSQSDVVTGTYATYHGEVPGANGITGGWQLEDDAYVVRDAYCLDFEYGTQEFRPGDEVQVATDTGYQTVSVAKVELTSGFWAQGTAAGRLITMPSTSTTNYRALAAIDSSGYVKDSTGTTNLANINNSDSEYGGLVWKGTIHGWEWVDTGWTIGYAEGSNAPNVKAAPLFMSDLVDSSRETTTSRPDQGTSAGSAPYIAWTNPNNVTSGVASSTCALLSGETSQYLKCRVEADSLPHDDIRIVGIEISVTAQSTAGTGPLFTDMSLVNEVSGAGFYKSENKARRIQLSTAATYTFGGSSDTWGVDEISASDINSEDFYFVLQFDAPAAAGTASIDDVTFVIYYVPNNEKVWFYDGSADVATGEIHAYQIETGDFGSSNDAAGNMSIRSITAPEEIGVGYTMYSQPSGAGVKIGVVTSPPEYNLLPSEDEMEAEESSYESIKANFYENDESEAVYGATGASPAFTYDGESFAFLQAPIARSLDKPRHIAFHDNRLALGYKSGHVILSAIGVPNNFSGVDSASSWGVGDRVTGLVSLAGKVLGVFSEASMRSLEGSSESTGSMRTISSTTGMREYTLSNIASPYFADNRGIGSVQTSDKYGDFDLGRLSDPIRTWVQDRMQERRATRTLDPAPKAAIGVRNKNQYRVFFKDGYVLVMYFRVNGAVEPTFMHYDTENFGTDYVPTWIDSHVLTNGQERIMMGTADGKVWVVDGANIIQAPDGVVKPDCWFVLNPINFRRPEALHKQFHIVVQGQFYGAQTVEAWGSGNYIFNATGSADDTAILGSYSNLPLFTAASEVDSLYLPMLTDGFSAKIQTEMDGSQPHTFQSMMFRASTKGVDRNSAPKRY